MGSHCRLPLERAPGPDDFIDKFFRVCWETMKEDIMEAFQKFYHVTDENFVELNTTLIAQIPKEGATMLGHYRPISLIHSIAKVITKVMSMSLSNAIKHVISPAQSAFWKKNVYMRASCMSRAASVLYIGPKNLLFSLNWILQKLSTHCPGTIC